MRERGSGCIEPKGAKWRARVRVLGKLKTLGTYATREEAESALRGYCALVASGQVLTRAHTLRSFGALWLERRELAGARNIVTDRSRWERHVMTARFADVALEQITRAEIRAWLDELAAREAADKRGRRKLAPQTIRHAFNLVRGCLEAAVGDELLERNVARRIKLAALSKDEGWSYLLPDEQRAILGCERIPEAERMIIGFAIGTMLRQGEQWALELPDMIVDGEAPRVVVRWGSPGKRPKNGKIRVVPLFGLALAAARRWLELLPTYARENPFNLVFPTPRGCRRGKGKPPRGWPAHLRAAGLADPSRRHDGRALRWHDLRHTGASSLVAGWWGRPWRLVEVRDVLGHSSVTLTERYAHLAASELAAAGAATSGELPPRRSPIVPRPAEPAPVSARNQGARHSGFEPLAFGSGGLANDLSYPEDGAPRGTSGDHRALASLAERYLRAVAGRSRFAHRYGGELARAVLDAEAAASSALRRGAAADAHDMASSAAEASAPERLRRSL